MDTSTQQQRLYDQSKAAFYLDVSVSHFKRYVRPDIEIIMVGNLPRFDKDTLDEWIARTKQTAAKTLQEKKEAKLQQQRAKESCRKEVQAYTVEMGSGISRKSTAELGFAKALKQVT